MKAENAISESRITSCFEYRLSNFLFNYLQKHEQISDTNKPKLDRYKVSVRDLLVQEKKGELPEEQPEAPVDPLMIEKINHTVELIQKSMKELQVKEGVAQRMPTAEIVLKTQTALL